MKNISPLQNRVNPFGELIRTPARGAWMGNRGLIHNDQQQIVRPFKLKAWITCLLEFKGWHREVMTPGLYTELFFFDEATAMAAGHRPCAECRRSDFIRFKRAWLQGNSSYLFNIKTSIREIDEILHQERIDAHQHKVKYTERLSDLPDGTFIEYNGNAYLIMQTELFMWTASGYKERIHLPVTQEMMVLTPRSIVNTLRAEYRAQVALPL